MKLRRILFLCAANSARSQMAEGIARSLAPKEFVIFSAGSNPSLVHPLAIKALAEIGINIRSHCSKHVNEIDLSLIDLVVTLCADEVCPIFSDKVEKLHWGLPDPAIPQVNESLQLEEFRKVRDELRKRIPNLFK